MKAPKTAAVFGQLSWTLESGAVTASVTQVGGHLAPVNFHLGRKTVQPYCIAPWWNETIDRSYPACLGVSRGDFFCMPFGLNALPYRGANHLPHGDTANLRWKPIDYTKSEEEITLRLGMELKSFSARLLPFFRPLSGLGEGI